MDLSLNAWANELGLPGMGDNTNVLNPHEEPIQDVVEPPVAPPDLSEDMGLAEDNEAALEDCMALFASIIESGGMNQSYATEAQRIMPDFCNSAPLGYYTKLPSATMLSVSLEAISLKIGALIAAGIAAVSMIIYKILKWLFGTDDNKDPQQMAKAIEVRAEETAKAQEPVDDALQDVAKAAKTFEHELAKGIEVEVPQTKRKIVVRTVRDVYKELVDESSLRERAEKFMDKIDPIFADFIQNGEMTKRMAELTRGLSTYKVQIDNRISALSKAMAELTRENQAGFNKDSVDFLREAKQEVLAVHDGATVSLRELIEDFYKVREQTLSKGAVKVHFSFTEVIDKFAFATRNVSLDKVNDGYIYLTHTLANTQKALEDLRKQTGTMLTDNQRDTLEREDADFFRKRREELTELCMDISKLLHIFKQHMHQIRNDGDQVVAFAASVASVMEKHLRAEGADWKTLPDSIKAIKESTKKATDAVRKRNAIIRQSMD